MWRFPVRHANGQPNSLDYQYFSLIYACAVHSWFVRAKLQWMFNRDFVQMPICCVGKPGGRMNTPNCSFGFESYSFLDPTHALSPPPPPVSPTPPVSASSLPAPPIYPLSHLDVVLKLHLLKHNGFQEKIYIYIYMFFQLINLF